MPYTPPTTFVAATPVTGTDIQSNFDALRYYIDRQIQAADFLKPEFKTADLVRGEYVGVTTDHQFTTGDLYTQVVDTDQFARSYMTSHFKISSLTNDFLYQIIPNSGKKIYPEMPAIALYTVSVSIVGNPNYQLEGERLLSDIKVYFSDVTSSGGIDNLNASDFIDPTFGGAFTEDWFALIPPVDANNSGNTAPAGVMSRRWYTVHIWRTLTAGKEYNFGLGISPNCDKLYVSARNANIELFYQGNNI